MNITELVAQDMIEEFIEDDFLSVTLEYDEENDRWLKTKGEENEDSE